ncbi:DNA repair protein RecO [Patescibacteria group bacterium]|nr:DNA repair protein RecO [Patescibacteria group bacterium]
MKSYKAEAIVLGGFNLGETDRILTLFTRRYGKVKVVAKGVRRIISRKAGSLDDFSWVWLVLARGKSLDIITEVELLKGKRDWRDNLIRVGLAYYLTEIVDRMTAERQPHEFVFEALVHNLNRLGQPRPADLVRPFEEEVLERLGFGIPDQIRKVDGSLVTYIEQIVEGSIKSKEVLRKIKYDRINVGEN